MYKLNENAWFKESEEYIKSLKKSSAKPVTAVCPVCGNIRTGPFYAYNRQKTTTCHPCFGARIGKEFEGKIFGDIIVLEKVGQNNFSKTMVRCLCPCGEEFITLLTHLRYGHTKSCGCRFFVDKYKSEERLKSRKSRAYKIWSRKVKQAFGYTCFICGEEEKLISHHIESFTDNPELRFDVHNGVCLCDDCHKEYHHNFMGCTQNYATKESLVAFMEYKICQRLQL